MGAVGLQMLIDFTIRDFKSFERGTLPLAELTVLIGANASGKSNLLEGLQLLSWLAQGLRLDALLVALEKRDVAVRGSIADLARDRKSFRLGCAAASSSGETLHLEIAIAVVDDGMRIVSEKLERDGDTVALYEIARPADAFSNQIAVAYNNFARGSRKPQIPAIDQQAIFTQLTTPARFDAGHQRSQTEIPACASVVQAALENILFLDPIPAEMRKYSYRVDARKLRGDGSNLSSVLAAITQTAAHKADVLQFVRSLPEQDITDVRFIEGPRGEIMVELVESFGGIERPVSARLLSDGTLRVLAAAAAVLSVPEGSLVVIEELDNGVHPPRVRALVDAIVSFARKRRIQVLLTTHNPAFLDAIPSTAISDAVACYRDPVDGTSKVVRLSDLENYPELVAEGPLGHVVTKGTLDRILKRPTTTETREEGLKRLFDVIGRDA